ncbi:type II toxin-antitoxin system VapB family antitoxin [Sphingomonas sp.]|jgi:Arc/MetJ family transcription regulator|uniref:type II toxin-antitoxin system VapB family antitoxin n=1 Tax=Sphingomonas sp. TaxID=28214 RepID=UPI002E357CA7|nr:type II toxin-antitoxin system VapB family antitoxin [Sphingomonas sp.]HEX4695559.1 type II toxin-antitoxin system VapB family antitoxin [Sphingomonas sp.]
MRTNIDIDDALMADALAETGARTKRDVVHQALEELVRYRRQLKILELKGIGWTGDLDAMRLDKQR